MKMTNYLAAFFWLDSFKGGLHSETSYGKAE